MLERNVQYLLKFFINGTFVDEACANLHKNYNNYYSFFLFYSTLIILKKKKKKIQIDNNYTTIN